MNRSSCFVGSDRRLAAVTMRKSRSKIHPNHKTRYRVASWAEYDRSLRQRGDITIGFTPAAMGAWKPLSAGLRGGQLRYSDVAIEVALALRMRFGVATDRGALELISVFDVS